ncbi:MAG: hypothetical protein OXE94_12700 [Aestuariivita sp.]|nr:hypothetical protein [Aestuariivita sp.]MCY4202488.1 hypothetical protein [Aestuariivita sp.]
MKRITATLVAGLVATTMIAAPVAASNDATCDDAAKLAGWASGYWDNTAQVCRTRYPYNPPTTPSQQEINADNRRSNPDARAVYYGTPPDETGTATASIGSGMICITFPGQEPKLTGRNNIKRVGVHGGDGYHDSGVVLTESGDAYGKFLHFGYMYIDRAMQCVSARGRLANAVPGTEFPIELRPMSAGLIVDATDPNRNCAQRTQTTDRDLNIIPDPGFVRDSTQGRCGQWHYTFRKMAHCAGAGGSENPSAGSCRIWVSVEN